MYYPHNLAASKRVKERHATVGESEADDRYAILGLGLLGVGGRALYLAVLA